MEKIEQKPAGNSGKKSEDVIEEKDMTEYKKGFECGKQYVLKYPEEYNLCKKIAWSEDDERILNTVIHNLRYPGVNYYKKPIEEEVKWLKSLKGRIQKGE